MNHRTNDRPRKAKARGDSSDVLGRTPDTVPKWRIYERIVAALEAENVGMDMTITSNTHVKGIISKVPRQIDALIEARWESGTARRIIVDAKRRRRKLDVNDVGAFLTMLEDCGAERGILYSPRGWTQGAERLARDQVVAKLLDAETCADTSWAQLELCAENASQGTRPCSGVVLWDGQLPLNIGGFWAIVYTGKCDVCHRFHVWCWDCGERFRLGVGEQWSCSCGRKWMSFVQDNALPHDAIKYAYLALLVGGGRPEVLDRVPLSPDHTKSGLAAQSDNDHMK